MVDRVIISATVEKQIRDRVKEIAKKEKRSFSNMIDLLLFNGLEVYQQSNNAANTNDKK